MEGLKKIVEFSTKFKLFEIFPIPPISTFEFLPPQNVRVQRLKFEKKGRNMYKIR